MAILSDMVSTDSLALNMGGPTTLASVISGLGYPENCDSLMLKTKINYEDCLNHLWTSDDFIAAANKLHAAGVTATPIRGRKLPLPPSVTALVAMLACEISNSSFVVALFDINAALGASVMTSDAATPLGFAKNKLCHGEFHWAVIALADPTTQTLVVVDSKTITTGKFWTCPAGRMYDALHAGGAEDLVVLEVIGSGAGGVKQHTPRTYTSSTTTSKTGYTAMAGTRTVATPRTYTSAASISASPGVGAMVTPVPAGSNTQAYLEARKRALGLQ